ncbi:substrate-binding domain-containing protein [Vibrio tarriae]|uniref:substrate-binding domain-containing protein n=1 Tax=Vibrio tarriae TaxID=2014742 RepID=UPI000DE3E0C9|nr:substrate-binding domain-containing protein [Vibrio tarriae]RBM44792.1 spermidine/putrescine ABC transporter permease [Vibrio tarriae]
MNGKLLALSLFSLSVSHSVISAEINLYGAGGPHHALNEIVQKFKENDRFKDIKININPGPYTTWESCAKGLDKSCNTGPADILWGTSENYYAVLEDEFKKYGFTSKLSKSIYLRPAVILVQKGNPKHIHGIEDLINNPEVKRIVVNNHTLKSVTSATALWEDIVGRKGKLEDVEKFRSKIVYQASGSGAAAKAFLGNQQQEKADAWITWPEWYHANTEKADMIEIEPDRVIYRDLNVTIKQGASEEATAFYDYLSSKEAFDIFQKYNIGK